MTDKALVFIRKSKGKEDDIGLEIQREKLPELAEKLTDNIETLDLGVHTGFSIHSREHEDPRIDANEKVQEMLDDLRDGNYSYLVAWDDTRLARDQFISEIERAAKLGGCDIVFKEDVSEDELVYGVKRTVEREVKKEEIEKSKQAIERRQEKGYYHGKPPFGFQYGPKKQHLVKNPDEFEKARNVILLKENNGYTYREIKDKTGISLSTIYNILDRKEIYKDPEKVRELY